MADKRAHMTRPCENCPYRMDAPRKLWHKLEFEGVLATEADLIGRTYACHKQVALPAEERGLCAGWLADQKRRNLPSIALRLALSRDPSVAVALDAVDTTGLKMFPTVKAMCAANGVRKARPKPPVIRLTLTPTRKR